MQRGQEHSASHGWPLAADDIAAAKAELERRVPYRTLADIVGPQAEQLWSINAGARAANRK